MTLKIYTASAGSGKTHTIACEYLKIALEDSDNFSRILAVTFTNKAALEMKHRILNTLHDIANARLGSLANTILIQKGWTAEELIERANAVLKNILHNYSKFSVSTIDSFFQRIIRTFSKELGLPQNFELTLNTSEKIDQIIDTVLQKLPSDENLKTWILKISSDRILQGKNWDPTSPLTSLCQELLTERGAIMIDSDTTSDEVLHFMKRLDKILLAFEKKLQTIGTQAMQLFREHHLVVENFLYGKAGVAGFLEKISKKDIPTPPGKRVLAATETSANWHSKTSAIKDHIAQMVEEEGGGMQLLHTSISFYTKHHTLYNSAKIAKKNLHLLGIGTYFARELRKLKKKENTIFLSDAAQMAHTVTSKTPPQDLFSQLDLSGDSVFIDEFQDISELQWQCLRPLIESGIRHGHPSIVVGDVKQAIYRWRNSDWRLLQKQIFADIKDTYLQTLETNWRSERQVILFNNTLFRAAAKLLHQNLEARLGEIDDAPLRNELRLETDAILAIYEKAAQTPPPQNTNHQPTEPTTPCTTGYVRVELIEQSTEHPPAEEEILENDSSWEKEATQAVVTLIENLQEQGFPAKDIAILVRNHKEASTISSAMQEREASPDPKPHCSYAVASSSSFCLGQNKWVNLAISTMKHALSPEDKLVLYELELFHHLCSRANNSQAAQANHPALHHPIDPELLERTKLLPQLPLIIILSEIENIFGINNTEARPFLEKLGDTMLGFAKRDDPPTNTLTPFLAWWQKHGRHQTLQVPVIEGPNATKILTIHQSKGLQFPIVILPFCSWDLDHAPTQAPLLWCKDSELGKFSAPRSGPLPITYSADLKETFFAKAYFREQIHSYIDNLNLLYVACTRPEKRLYIFAKKSQHHEIKSMNELINATLGEKNLFAEENFFETWEHFWAPGKRILEIGENGKNLDHDGERMKNFSEKKFSEKKNQNLFEKKKNLDTEKNFIKSPEKNFEKILENLSGKKFSVKRKSHATLGENLHQLLAQIHLLEDMPKILEKIETLPLTNPDKAYLRQTITKLYHHERVQAWFQETWRHKVEATFMTREGKILRADRVLLSQDAASAIVLEFKTGIPNPAHTKQVQEYMHCLIDMGHQTVEGHLLYLRGDSVKVLEVHCTSAPRSTKNP